MGISNKELTARAKAIRTKVDEDKQYTDGEVVKIICEYWSVIGPVAQMLKLVTNDKVDKIIDDFSALIDDVCGKDNVDAAKQSELIAKFCEVWPMIKAPLKIVKLITNSKVDKIIDEFLKLGESICD